MATLTLRPNGAGDTQSIPHQYPDSTYHWDKVDEATADDATTYVFDDAGAGNWVQDFWALSDHGAESGTINSVTAYARVQAAANNDHKAKVGILTENTAYYGSEETLSTTWTTISKAWTTNPKVGGAWTWTQVDAMQAIVMLYSAGGAIVVKCTQFYAVVDYTPPPVLAKVNIGGVWKDVPSMSVNIGGTWKSVVSVKVNIGGTWKAV